MATGLDTFTGAVATDVGDLLGRRFAAVDAKDLDAFRAVHREAHHFVFGGRPPVVGLNEMSTQVEGFWAAIGGLNHHVQRVAAVGDTVYVESVIEYERLDGRVVQVPCCDVFRVEAGAIAETRAYLDQGPVWA